MQECPFRLLVFRFVLMTQVDRLAYDSHIFFVLFSETCNSALVTYVVVHQQLRDLIFNRFGCTLHRPGHLLFSETSRVHAHEVLIVLFLPFLVVVWVYYLLSNPLQVIPARNDPFACNQNTRHIVSVLLILCKQLQISSDGRTKSIEVSVHFQQLGWLT